MMKNSPLILATLFSMIGLALPINAVAQQPVVLKLKPSQCVAMRQGQACFADVLIEWQAPDNANICLHSSQQARALHCWKAQKQGTWESEVKAFNDITFTLVSKHNQKSLAEGKLEVAWVYKKNVKKNAIWRMF